LGTVLASTDVVYEEPEGLTRNDHRAILDEEMAVTCTTRQFGVRRY